MAPRFNGALPELGGFGPMSHEAAGLAAVVWQLEQSQWWPEEEHRARQLEQLERLLSHAWERVPLYRERWAEAGYRPGEPLTWEGFRALPSIAREQLAADPASLQAADYDTTLAATHGPTHPISTSGSTGTPVSVLTTGVTRLMWSAITTRDHLWRGRDFSRRQAVIHPELDPNTPGLDPAAPAIDAVSWSGPASRLFQTGPGAFMNSRTPVDRQLAWLGERQPAYLRSLPSNIEALARESLARGEGLPGLRQVASFGERLRPEVREVAREAWGVEISDTYIAREVGYLALQCAAGHHHLQSESVVVEVLDDEGRPVAAGESGRAVVTLLHNFAMPLIRYAIGDWLTLAEGGCECGRGLPRVESIRGRERNMLTLPDGRLSWPSFPSSAWIGIAPIRQIQLRQMDRGRIVVVVYMERDLTEGEREALSRALAVTLGRPYHFDFMVRREPIRAKNGKYEDFVNLIDVGQAG